jgi:subfamily B ATP-binding cassette protein MsbA
MNIFKRLLTFSKPYWWRISLSAFASAGVGSIDALIAYMVAPFLTQVIKKGDTTFLLLMPLAIVIVFSFRGFCRYVNEYFIRTAGQLAIQDIRSRIYHNNMNLSLSFFTRNTTGILMSRVLNDVTIMQEGVANVITGLFRDGLGAAFLMGVLFYRNWRLALIASLVIPLTVYPAQKIGRRIKNLSKSSQGKMGDISSILQETFSGIKVIKAFGLEGREIEKFIASNRGYYHFMRKSIKYEALSAPVMEVITSFGVAAVIWFGVTIIRHGAMGTAEFLSFLTAMGLFYNPLKKLISSYNVMQRAIGAAERVFEVIDEKAEITDPVMPVELHRASGDVSFKEVSFQYGNTKELVLKKITLFAQKGEIVALVGPSGSGKTTLVSLLMRFYDVTGGKVTIDGINIQQLMIRDLMHQIALVDQETFLFNDTIANNIRYGKTDATDAEVMDAAKAAFAHDFIMEMPDDYSTNIGDRGVRLSGGQRQRICIARAILKDAPILILDEATSALDTESEQMVQYALNNLMANRTTFVIAHRLSTILHADKIVVLENGEIVESGRHDQLLALGGVYKKLYDMQFQS